jgi:glyoxylase-like metal-dependent hydrolase (beta-lactamase superfamily II)
MTESRSLTGLDAAESGRLRELGEDVYAFGAADGPNSGVIIGDDAVLVVDAQPSRAASTALREAVAQITDKPIRHLALTHHHAGRTAGASGLGVEQIFQSDVGRAALTERGQEDWDTALAWRPQSFDAADSAVGLTWPTITFRDRMTVHLGQRRVHLMHLGKAHTAGDIVVWVPDAGAMFCGDILSGDVVPYAGDACFKTWSRTLDAITDFAPEIILPGGGSPLIGDDAVDDAIDLTRDYVLTLYASVNKVVNRDGALRDTIKTVRRDCDARFGGLTGYEETLPFNIARAFDEAQGIESPRIWTPERSLEIRTLLGA